MIRIGIDLGGTKIEAATMDSAGNIQSRKRISTPASYQGMVNALTGLVGELQPQAAETCPVGVGHPGSEDRDSGLIRGANSTWLNGRSLRADLSAALEREVRLSNDANCFALSEAIDGSGAGAASVFGVILGTGVGGGMVVDGQLLAGAQGIAGEWGHNPLPWLLPDEFPGPDCWCGQSGCIETWLSGPGIAADRYGRTGETMTPSEILAHPEEFDRYASRLARALAHVVNLLDPEVIVLGGGVSNTPGLAEAVESALPRHVFNDRVTTLVRRHLHGDSSGVRGAAWLWPAN
ncbi:MULTISPECIES: ROK family protein [Hyphobacterium]|uniref:ROK family protein n=1 Tax=Hyphobacterium vulgare TaxID=1736751 RepID=A0ABV6ZTU1_9PROT